MRNETRGIRPRKRRRSERRVGAVLSSSAAKSGDSTPDLVATKRLLARYLAPVPRYTSYPTAPAWSEHFGPGDLRKELLELDRIEERGLSLYVHVPFCSSLCHFCACNRVITQDEDRPRHYLDAIETEIALVRRAVPGAPRVSQLHWGGGTPTHLRPEQIGRLHRVLTDAFPLGPVPEISIEIDPRVTSEDHLDALADCGFNRISMGVQDFDPVVQKAIHRFQPYPDTRELVEQCRARGMENVNLDLIYGLPCQSVTSFMRTLDAVLEIRPNRIALYSYAHVTWKAKQQRSFERKQLPDAATKIAILIAAIERLLDAGYVHIGMDHFALPEDDLAHALAEGSLRRNFMGYTTQAELPVLAFGPSGISELPGGYAQSERDVDAWETTIRHGGLATIRGHRMTPDDVERRWIISHIMCDGALHAEAFQESFGKRLADAYERELRQLAKFEVDGLVEIGAAGSLHLTFPGRLLVRNVAAVFDAYLPEQIEPDRPVFSSSV